MKFKNIHFILNPAAGSEEPILSSINNVFCESGIKWTISITQKKDDAFTFAKAQIGKADLVAVYGGDGSLTEVARALCGTDTPMAILPGGTANVTAKELGIPLDVVAALQMLTSGNNRIIKIDTATVNKQPFIIRVNLGIMADMILNADSDLKAKAGQLAYGITTVKSIAAAKPVNYKLTIDGKTIKEKGVALTVTNAGSLGIGTFALLPDIKVDDGYLDVILMKDTGLMDMLKITGSTLLQKESDVLQHWKCREVTISLDETMPYICDDIKRKAQLLRIKVIPAALNVVVPA